MGCRSCGGKSTARPTGCRSCKKIQEGPSPTLPDSEIYVVQYLGANTGAITYRGPSGKRYRFAAGYYAMQKVAKIDAGFFASLRQFKVVTLAEFRATSA
jgi:hypothetical protein